MMFTAIFDEMHICYGSCPKYKSGLGVEGIGGLSKEKEDVVHVRVIDCFLATGQRGPLLETMSSIPRLQVIRGSSQAMGDVLGSGCQ